MGDVFDVLAVPEKSSRQPKNPGLMTSHDLGEGGLVTVPAGRNELRFRRIGVGSKRHSQAQRKHQFHVRLHPDPPPRSVRNIPFENIERP